MTQEQAEYELLKNGIGQRIVQQAEDVWSVSGEMDGVRIFANSNHLEVAVENVCAAALGVYKLHLNQYAAKFGGEAIP